MPLIRRALGLGLILAAIHAARPSGVAAQTGEQHWQLALANYTLSALAQFTGKVIRRSEERRVGKVCGSDVDPPVVKEIVEKHEKQRDVEVVQQPSREWEQRVGGSVGAESRM